MPGLLDDVQEYARRSGRNLTGLLDWLGGGAQAGAEPLMALLRGDALNEPLLPTAASGGRVGAVASALGSTLMPVAAPAGAMGAGPVLRGTNAALDMSPEARAARAAELGYTTDVYHSTRATEPFAAFRPIGGPQRHDLHGTHVGTLEAADERAQKYFGGADYGAASGVANEGQAASIMPLKAKVENPWVKKDGSPFSEAEIRQKVAAFAKKTGLRPDSIDAKIKFRQELLSQGYDAIPYINSVEDRGSLSYLMLKPENLRSRFAAFDPARVGEANLLASRVPLSGLLSQPPQPLTLDDLKDRL